MNEVWYPWITHHHKLDGPTGNAFVIMGAVTETMRQGDISEEEKSKWLK